ncbi:MAG: hypothetical protein AAFU79_19740 [Myxococcota bacterium]
MEHFADPQAALAAEVEGLSPGRGGGSCRAWTTVRSMVVPRAMTRRGGFREAQASLEERGFPIVVRASGGGLVPQGPGILNISVTLPTRRHEGPANDYAWLCGQLRAFVGGYGFDARTGAVPGSFCDGEHNVVVTGRKLAGTAQRRGQARSLLHAVILVDPELEPALEAVRCARAHLGDPAPLRSEAHVTLSELTETLSDPARVASELIARLQAGVALHLAARRPKAS